MHSTDSVSPDCPSQPPPPPAAGNGAAGGDASTPKSERGIGGGGATASYQYPQERGEQEPKGEEEKPRRARLSYRQKRASCLPGWMVGARRRRSKGRNHQEEEEEMAMEEEAEEDRSGRKEIPGGPTGTPAGERQPPVGGCGRREATGPSVLIRCSVAAPAATSANLPSPLLYCSSVDSCVFSFIVVAVFFIFLWGNLVFYIYRN